MTYASALFAVIVCALFAGGMIALHRSDERAFRERERQLGREMTPGEVWCYYLGVEPDEQRR
ncbi:hypothetical protein ACW2Q0_20970 [Nocardia sp. R16R-3T]